MDLGADPLGQSRDDMRRIGYATVDLLVDLLSQPDAVPALRRATRDDMEARIDGPPPAGPRAYEEVLAQLARDVLPFTSRGDHPGYFAFIPSNGTWPSSMGDLVASALNIYAGSWMEAAGPSQVELTVLDWFRQWIGYPPGAAGVLVSGGSAANMTALALAREHRVGAMDQRVVAYVADQAHSSMARAGRILGFRPDQVRVLPVDRDFRLDPGTLQRAIDADRTAGYRPMFLAAVAGSTNAGAIDPLPRLADVCQANDIWFHVDAAYGGFAMLTDRGKRWLTGIERADSVTLDPHKWLYQPFECGCLLVRDGDRLRTAFEITPDYLADAQIAHREVNFSDLGIQLTRMSRALKIWMSVQTFGIDAFRKAIDRAIDLARAAQARIVASDEFELLLPASLGVVCFRRHPKGIDDERDLEAVNSALVRDLADSGIGLLSSTRLRGTYAIRLCVLNHTSGTEDVDRVLSWLEAQPPDVGPEALSTFAQLDDVQRVFGEFVADSLVALADVPLFTILDDADLAMLDKESRREEVGPGEVLIREWDPTRDFYVLLEGSAEVRRDGDRLAVLTAGDYFGEIAAMDWGASFGYNRTASIVTSSPCRVLVVPNATFQKVMRSSSEFAGEIRRTARGRTPEPT